MAQMEPLRQRLERILSGQTGTAAAPALAARQVQTERHFSPFVFEDMLRAAELATEFMRAAEQRGGEPGLTASVDAIEQRLGAERPGLLQYATKLYLTHYAPARELLRIGPLQRRQPRLVLPSAAPGPGGATSPEDRLSFWREDPLLNEHHEHWHLVYPLVPVPLPEGPKPAEGYNLGDRHGELFAYMHEQMLARYDAERLSAGLERVQPFAEFRAPIPQGYDPGELLLWDGDDWYQFGLRPAGATISDITFKGLDKRPGSTISAQERFCALLFTAATDGTYDLTGQRLAVTIDNLGATVEATANAIDFYGKDDARNFQAYGNFHNDGHIHFMLYDNTQPFGVMGFTSTAIRDPVFFRWHKQIDDIFSEWQERQTPHDFADGPRVRVRKTSGIDGDAISPDIILCRADGLPPEFAGEKVGSDAYFTALANAAFGFSTDADTNQWDLDASAAAIDLGGGVSLKTVSELTTEMRKRTIELEDSDGNPVGQEIDYLSHDDFYYLLRVENLLETPQNVTVRIFLAPQSELDDRRSWIEMDRFSYHLAGRERAVIVRPAEESSVIRKPALKPEDLTPSDEPDPKTDQQAWCDCGWPYTLLLPRGTREGMSYRLFVMYSPGDDLIMPAHPTGCTSISYCGLQDMPYPDRRPMGYPFDRSFNRSITSTVAQHENMAWRTITIRCVNG